MTDKQYIRKYLKRHYKFVATRQEFMPMDKTSGKCLDRDSFKNEFKTIFSNFMLTKKESSIEYVMGWYNKSLNKEMLGYEKFINNLELNLNEGSISLIKKLRNKYPVHVHSTLSVVGGFNIHEYSGGRFFMEELFIKMYKNSHITKMINEYTNELDKKGGDISSDEALVNIQPIMDLETDEIKKHITYKIHDWYFYANLEGEVRDFFQQLVITLGSRDWRVTWIGHGEFTEKRISEYFKNESKYQINKIKLIYREWYANEVILASERVVLRNQV